ncbi:hypothetical protein FHT93_002703 [Rhizobium sp. BK379]|nr:hypothetical protein [Rhizobium sp. BK379]
MVGGTGLTLSGPAFFDIAALADRPKSGNIAGRVTFAKQQAVGRKPLPEGLKTPVPFVS